MGANTTLEENYLIGRDLTGPANSVGGEAEVEDKERAIPEARPEDASSWTAWTVGGGGMDAETLRGVGDACGGTIYVGHRHTRQEGLE